MRAPRLLVPGLLLFAAPVFAQSDAVSGPPPARNTTTVYKCVNADGSVVFAETPCAADPAKVQTIDTSGALKHGSGGNQAEIAASVADSDCRERAYATSHHSADQIEESKRHVAEYQQRLQNLAQQPAYPSEDANRQAVDELNTSIAREQEFQQKAAAGDEQAYQAALKACDAEQRRSTQPPARPPGPQTPPGPNSGGSPPAGNGS